jgi:hypothetical protein
MHKTKDEDKQNKKTTQYVLDTTIHKTQDEDKQTIKHNAISVGHHHSQDKRRRQTKQKTQHNICWTTPYTMQKTTTNKPKTSTQCDGHYYAQCNMF